MCIVQSSFVNFDELMHLEGPLKWLVDIIDVNLTDFSDIKRLLGLPGLTPDLLSNKHSSSISSLVLSQEPLKHFSSPWLSISQYAEWVLDKS